MAAPINHKSGKSDKIWREALMRAVHRISKDGKTKHLEILADRLVLKAAAGDVPALREIGDRIDGKPTQQITGVDGGAIEIGLESSGQLARLVGFLLQRDAKAGTGNKP